MNKIKRLFLYVINLPLYWISNVVPKNEKIWIFGAWFGDKYGDNSKYFFEYINENHPEIKAVWLTSNEDTLNLIKKKGVKVYNAYSIFGYYLSARAKFSFVSTGFDDVNKYIPTPIIVNLWHGHPLKKIMYDDKINYLSGLTLKWKILKFLFPYLREGIDFDFTISSSNDESRNLSTAFRKNEDKILITGLPRNDIFSCNKLKIKKELKRIIYMPTHRDSNELNITKLFLNDIEYINKSLNENNMELFIKLHFYNMKDIDFKSYSNIKILLDADIEEDIYSVINEFDILITDYSSIYFDYLLSNCPIIFAPFDYDNYIMNNREFYYDYNTVTPGPKCKNWKEVLTWILKFKDNPELYKEERISIKNRFHQFQNGSNCERVYENVQKIIKKLK